MSMSPSRHAIESVTLRDVAADNRLFIVRCVLCRRQEAYMATDLMQVYDPATPAYGMLQWCGNCGTADWVRVTIRLPMHDDVGHLRIRRPAGVRVEQLWEDAWYG